MAPRQTTTRVTRSRTSNRIEVVIPDSDGFEEIPSSEPGELVSKTGSKTGSKTASRAVMQEVRIPSRSRTSNASSKVASTRDSTTDLSDLSLSNEANDTSATSAAATPAVTGRSRKPRVSAAAIMRELRESDTRSKRKRSLTIENSDSESDFHIASSDEEDYQDSDGEIARRLQEEEYMGLTAPRKGPNKKRRTGIASQAPIRSRKHHALLPPPAAGNQAGHLDILDDSSELSDIMSFDDSDDILGLARTHFGNSSSAPKWDFPDAEKFYQRYGYRAYRERAKLVRSHPEVSTLWEDLKQVEPVKPVRAAQPLGISRTLKPFQLEGLDWMMKQEQTQWKGGLLGDEMGMGKTIQAVSLIMSDYPAKKPTLVLVPPVALMQWQSEIAEYTGGKLSVLVYHGSNAKVKSMKRKDLLKYDVIMMSYSGLESMYRKQSKGWSRGDNTVKEDSVIHSIHYHRLILDEAHSIKSRTTGVAKACFALQSDYKWCLSGTPVQNRIGEFFSLLRFLEIKPLACYFCKVCPCMELHWSQDKSKRCTACTHSGFNHVSIFIQEILNPITGHDNEVRQEGMDKLRLITDRIMLRRLKRDHTSSMELPPKQVIIHNEFFGEIERDFSSSIMANTNRKFDTYVAQGVVLNNYANIFGLIMQMRQVANHPDLILKRHGEGGQNVLVCCICDEPAEEPIRSTCKHDFCRECVTQYYHTSGDSRDIADCPRCHIPLEIDLQQPAIEQDGDTVKKNSIINRIKMENWTSSTKIEMLVYDLYKLRSKKQTHKSIVFSQFTSMLQLVEWRLRRAGFNTVMLDGSMTPAQRQKSIEYFMNNVDVEVFLVSLKAGGVALNLTEASRVFLIDPWWNPAAEWQSADRCHRIGQRRPCVITRLCIEDSVESRIVLLQEKKANMINGTINNDQVAMEKLTPEDMQFLFRGS